MSSRRYYTPCLQEFHFGFEYEYRPILPRKMMSIIRGESNLYDTEFQVAIFAEEIGDKNYPTHYHRPISMQMLPEMIKDKAVRVKYLDKTDLLRLGFEIISRDEDERIIATRAVDTPRGLQQMKVIYNKISHWCLINLGNMAVSAGHIRNYTEMAKEMDRIGIKEIFKRDAQHRQYPLTPNDCEC